MCMLVHNSCGHVHHTCCNKGCVVSSDDAGKYPPGSLTLKKRSVLALPDEA